MGGAAKDDGAWQSAQRGALLPEHSRTLWAEYRTTLNDLAADVEAATAEAGPTRDLETAAGNATAGTAAELRRLPGRRPRIGMTNPTPDAVPASPAVRRVLLWRPDTEVSQVEEGLEEAAGFLNVAPGEVLAAIERGELLGGWFVDWDAGGAA